MSSQQVKTFKTYTSEPHIIMSQHPEKAIINHTPYQVLPGPYPGHKHGEYHLSANKQQMVIGGTLRKQLEKMVKTVERKIDKQVLSAQSRTHSTESILVNRGRS